MTASIDRREALRTATALLGGVFVAAIGLPACAPEPKKPASRGILPPEDQALLEEIADTLLPTTAASPGAKAAGAGATMNLFLTDCYAPDVQQRVVRGLEDFRVLCASRCGAGFASLPVRDREQLLREIDAEARKEPDTHYFGVIRELALRAYFSSEIGMTQALRYVRNPGRWTGCVPRTPGQPAWA